MPIHPAAIVHATAEVDPSADIGAYAIIERNARIGADAVIYPHAYISQDATLGARCQVHPFAVVGHLPQDLKYKGERSFTTIGDETVIREHATIHRGAMPGSTTSVGSRCYIMATGHVGHNSEIGDEVIIANSGLVAGHIQIGRKAFISGCTVLHQFIRIGEFAMLAGGIRVPKDVPPFMLAGPSGILGINVVGLRRAGFSSAERLELRECYRTLFRLEANFPRAIETIAQRVRTEPGQRLVEFLRAPSKRGYPRLKRPGHGRGEAEDEE